MAFFGDVDINIDPGTVDIKTKVNVMWETYYQFNRVSVLMFLDLDAAFADLVMLGGDLGLDGVLVPGIDMDVAVGGFDPQIRLARDGIALRPFIGMSKLRDSETQTQCD